MKVPLAIDMRYASNHVYEKKYLDESAQWMVVVEDAATTT